MNIRDFISPEIVCLDLKSSTKTEVLTELADILDKTGKISDTGKFLTDVWKREEIGNTGFELGIAIPHAKSAFVSEVAIVIGISRAGIDYGAEDGELSHVFFMLASPEGSDTEHVEVLAQLTSKLFDAGCVEKIIEAETKQGVIELLTNKNEQLGYAFPSENSDSSLRSPRLIAAVASQAKRHLLFGTSHMIPFIVAGGVLLSVAVMLSGRAELPESGLLADISRMGVAGLTLFPLALGGYIAYSLADKPGLAPGMIGTWIAVTEYNTGFLGAIFVGFVAGFTVRLLKKLPLPHSMISISSIFLLPLVGTFVTCGAVMWVLGEPIAIAMVWMNQSLESLAGSGKLMLGTILGAMTAFDMGGPINKVATLFAQTQVGTHPWLMGGVGIAICTPPLGMALATLLSPSKFKRDEIEAGKAAGIMGLIGITEGAIPFAVVDPLRVIPAIVLGGIVGNVIGFTFDVINHAPWGGWIVLPVVEGKVGYIIGTIAGAVTTAITVLILKKNVTGDDDADDFFEQHTLPEIQEGEADILAVTSCPSGVAHTFLAAKALNKAAYRYGVKIKVETQGANGINNKITAKDIRNAKLVILAHDIALKEPERFENISVINVSTRDAIYNSYNLIRSNS